MEDRNLPANAGDTDSIPGQVKIPPASEQLSPSPTTTEAGVPGARASTREAAAVSSPDTAAASRPRSPRRDRQRLSTAEKNKCVALHLGHRGSSVPPS